jgi:hypothetical protein
MGSSEVGMDSTVETTCLRTSLSDLESALESVRASFGVVSGDLLLINPDVFPLVPVL